MATLQTIRSKGPLLVVVIGLALFAFIAGDAWKVLQPHQGKQDVGEVNGKTLTAQEYQKMVDPILPLKHNGKITIRVSMNPEEIINKVEFGTSRLKERIVAINKLAEAEYKVGILIAPVILVENWKELYTNLIQRLNSELSEKVKKQAFFEIIFMTYSFVHTKINEEAFPNAINLYNTEIMTGRGKGKYSYKQDVRKEAEVYLRKQY